MFSQLRAISRHFNHHRSTRLTSEGVQFLLFTLAVGVAAINTGNNLFYLLLAMMLSIVLVSGIVAEYGLRRLEFHRHLPDLLFVKDPTTATLVAKNGKSRFPTFSIRLSDVIDGQDVDGGLTIRQLLPGTSQMLSYPLMATKRGRLQLEGIRVVTSFPFGLFVKKAYYPIPGTLVVCPEITPLDDDLIENLMAVGHEHHAHRRGHGNDLYNLRLYHSGDDSRNIHWATTAKTSKLIVRETEAEHQRRATIYLALEAPSTDDVLFEEAVAFAASLVSHLSNQGYRIRLVAGSYHSPFGQGATHIKELLQALALCERCAPNSNAGFAETPYSKYGDADEGALMVVRAWNGADMPIAANATILFDPATFAKASHAL